MAALAFPFSIFRLYRLGRPRRRADAVREERKVRDPWSFRRGGIVLQSLTRATELGRYVASNYV